jgi:hypothetical protein|tara:strand:- start:4356 stop:5009 length:654 start_codon:yes stop_codon:yes gene_type:complete
MKLISEHVDQDIQFIVEKNEKGEKSYMIEGVFAQAEQPNRNGRMYPMDVMEQAVGKYKKEFVGNGRAVGELNHPDGPTINLDKVSHLVTELNFKGNDVVGKAKILDTPNGNIAKKLLEGGVKLGVSTRGMGSLMPKGNVMVVKPDYNLNAIDIVQDPSAPGAFVNGIMEGVEWVWNNGIIEQKAIEQMETEIKNAPRSNRYVTEVREFKNFLSLLKQ